MNVSEIVIEQTHLRLKTDIDNHNLKNHIFFLRRDLKNYIFKNPDFQISLEPIKCEDNAPLIVRKMVEASTIADVGLDVPRLQTVVEAGAGKSSVTALQRLGRVMRPFEGKDECYFITYRDNAPFLCTQVDNKIRIWRTEPKFIIEEG